MNISDLLMVLKSKNWEILNPFILAREIVPAGSPVKFVPFWLGYDNRDSNAVADQDLFASSAVHPAADQTLVNYRKLTSIKIPYKGKLYESFKATPERIDDGKIVRMNVDAGFLWTIIPTQAESA